MRRDIFMRKLNPEKISQKLQDLNKYLDYISIERTTMAWHIKPRQNVESHCQIMKSGPLWDEPYHLNGQ
jgi:hypothetical protein